ncbi:MAG: hypothetical protein ACOC2F_07245 [Bacteroidota bacterium]
MEENRGNKKNMSFLILLIILCSCSINEKDKENDRIKYFSGMNFPDFEEPNTGLAHAVTYGDTLVITVEFSDCGEWGGRREKIILSRDENKHIKANFTKDTVCCDAKIISSRGTAILDNGTREIKTDITKILTLADEKLINLFIHRVLELSINRDSFNWFYEPPHYDTILSINEIIEMEEEIDIVIFSDDAVGTLIDIKSTSSNLNVHFSNYGNGANTWYGRVRKQLFGELLNVN